MAKVGALANVAVLVKVEAKIDVLALMAGRASDRAGRASVRWIKEGLRGSMQGL